MRDATATASDDGRGVASEQGGGVHGGGREGVRAVIILFIRDATSAVARGEEEIGSLP